MAKFISLVTTSLKPPFYNDIIKIIPSPTKKTGMLLNSWQQRTERCHGFKQSEIPLSSDGIIYFARAVGRQRAMHTENSRFASPTLGRHISTFRGYQIFIFYPKPLYKSFHQSFFYSFITILPSESGVTLHYSTILPQILLFRQLTSIFESTNVISRY